MSDVLSMHDPSTETVLGAVVDEFLERLGRGERPEVEEIAQRHPPLAAVLRQILPALQALHGSAADHPPATAGPAPASETQGLLGDFRLVREIGRGGMGIVYEAVQVSLGRRVALKVLPFAAALDTRQLQRFRNEAQAAAHLHHQHIVPVHYVGCERGTHFYAMQFIEGRTLAEVIGDLRSASASGGAPSSGPRPSRDAAPPEAPAAGAPEGGPAPDTLPIAGRATERSTRGPSFFRAVARLGQQAAEALEHAHREGIVHRDIKPANLLLDTRGNLWVTDFGLARLQSETGLTASGDLVGTLRYMSPEQALGHPVAVDQRTDVYALGATLYELLALRPVFPGRDRQELLRQITAEEPRPLRKLNPAVPAELEVIVLKALEKEAEARYATAQELADDLRRFLEDKPILARRPSRLEQARKWARRHRPVVWSAVVTLLVTLTVVAGSVGWVVGDRATRQARNTSAVQAALEEAQRSHREGHWPQALAAAQRAAALLPEGAADPALAAQVRDWLRNLAEEDADRRLVARLEGIRLRQAQLNVREERFSREETLPEYGQAFRDYGLAAQVLSPAEAAALIRRRPPAVRNTLLGALDHWLILARYRKTPDVGWLEEVLSQADSDAWRQRVRAARARNDRPALEQLAREVDVGAQPAEVLFVLSVGLRQRGAKGPALALLRRAQEAFPGDFWMNHDLGWVLYHCPPPQGEGAIRFLTAALALRPNSPPVCLNLGCALWKNGQREEAVAFFRKAIALNPDYAAAHGHLGDALLAWGRLDEAMAAFHKAVELKPTYAEAYFDLGSALWSKGRREDAVAAFRQAVERKPLWAEAHAGLGSTLVGRGQLDEAMASIQRALELKPACAEAHHALGSAMASKGRLEETLAAHRRAIALKPDYAEAHCDLGLALRQQGEFAQALAALKRGHELGSRRPYWPYPSAQWVKDCQRLLENKGGPPTPPGR
jgi:serine/threonine protein kinase/Flp pilus assembly protein TadD